MAIIFTRAHVPDELRQRWLQHLRDFDVAHPGCHFEVMIDGSPDTTIAEMIETLQVNPQMKFASFFQRKGGAGGQ